MEQNNRGLQANPQYTINYLTDELARVNQENAMLKAVIQEQNEKAQQTNQEEQ
ncbi:hypothetical protein [Staphylococcus sp. LKG3-3]|uniref:hypothetical protein n=1 Tax=Staphylococcus sp. LKG3-3 TaxID=3399685 RepID=UPI003D560CB1